MQSLSGKNTGDSLTATEWNQLPTEVQNVIISVGLSLTNGDLQQLGKAVNTYVASGTFYLDSGIANAYVLAPIGALIGAPTLSEGMELRFIANVTNTGASTVNPAGLGATDIVDLAGNPLSAGQITTGLNRLYYRTSDSSFVLEPSQAGFDITGLTEDIPNGAEDFAPFFDQSTATNKKSLVSTLANRTWKPTIFSSNFAISNVNEYSQYFYKTAIASPTITVNDSTNANLVGTSFVVSNQSSGDITVNGESVTTFLQYREGLGGTPASTIVIPRGYTKIFFRQANNAYLCGDFVNGFNQLDGNRLMWPYDTIGATETFTLADDLVDYRKLWDMTTGSTLKTINVTDTGGDFRQQGTSFIVNNRSSGGGNVLVDFGANFCLFTGGAVNSVTVSRGATFMFYAMAADFYLCIPLVSNFPVIVPTWENFGTLDYYSDNQNNNVFVSVTNSAATQTFFTIGPTGSGADVIFSEMDVIPFNGTKAEFYCTMLVRSNSGVQTELYLDNRATSNAGGWTSQYRVMGMGSDNLATGERIIQSGLITLPLDSLNRISVAWNGADMLSPSITLALRSFSTAT